MPDHLLESGDSPELEALFESIAKQQASQQEAPSAEVDGANPQAALAIYAQVGQMTRKLHDALRELGYDKSLEKVADALPDAKDRLGYIATLTANAAERVLNATDIARPIQDELQSQSASLSGRWDQLFANQLSVDDFKLLAALGAAIWWWPTDPGKAMMVAVAVCISLFADGSGDEDEEC